MPVGKRDFHYGKGRAQPIQHSSSSVNFAKETRDAEEAEKTLTMNSQEEIEPFVQNQKSINTRKKTNLDMNTLRSYLKGINYEALHMESLPPEQSSEVFAMKRSLLVSSRKGNKPNVTIAMTKDE